MVSSLLGSAGAAHKTEIYDGPPSQMSPPPDMFIYVYMCVGVLGCVCVCVRMSITHKKKGKLLSVINLLMEMMFQSGISMFDFQTPQRKYVKMIHSLTSFSAFQQINKCISYKA